MKLERAKSQNPSVCQAGPTCRHKAEGWGAAGTKLLLRPEILPPVWSYSLKYSHLFISLQILAVQEKGEALFIRESTMWVCKAGLEEKNMPREAFYCIFNPKEQPVKGTPVPAVGLQPAEFSLFSLRCFWAALPISFPCSTSIHTLPPQAHQALRAAPWKPNLWGITGAPQHDQGSSSCQPWVPQGGGEQWICLDGLIRLPKISFQARL